MVIDAKRHKFPWPASAAQRYCDESPWLAVVNARGPWPTWLHGRANPPYIPLCLSLWSKAFWRDADAATRVFCLEMWRHAAMEDPWGIVWGDPAKLRRRLGMESAEFTLRLEAMLKAGWLVYLTDAERAAAMAWRRQNERERGSKRGKEREQSRAEHRRAEQSTGEPSPAVSQESSCSASARQIPGSEGRAEQSTGEHSTGQESTAQQSKSQPEPQGQPQPREPANLPKSDDGAAGGSDRTPGGVRGRKTPGRPLSVSGGPRDAGGESRIGDLLAWGNPAAVVFGRGMYEAITGHRAPQDLTAAEDQIKGDVGTWVHYWVDEVEPAVPMERRGEFAERCVRDVRKKLRSERKPKNPGGLARARIVPGILAAMAKGTDA